MTEAINQTGSVDSPSSRQYIRFLSRYLRGRMHLVVMLTITLFASISLQIVNPQIMRVFIDETLGGGSVGHLQKLAILFIVLAIIQQLIGVLVVYITEVLGWAATNDVRLDLGRHMLGLDMSFHTAHTPGEIIERIDGDVMALSNFFSQFIIQVFGNALLVLGILVILILEDWRVSISLTIFVAITVTILLRMVNYAVPSWKLERQASADLFGFLEERLSGTEDIRANNAVEYVLHRFYILTRDLMRKTIIANFRWATVMNTTWVLFAVGNAIGLGVGAYLYYRGDITIGSVFMIVYYTNMINWPLERITQQFQDLQRAGASLVRIMGVQQIKGKISGEDEFSNSEERILSPGALAVTFENVTFGYDDSISSQDKTDGPEEDHAQEKELVLCDVSFQLTPGRVLGLLGRTGSGKTTLTRLLFRLYDADGGSIRLDDINIQNLPIQELRRGIGMVTQNIQLFHATVRENLTYFDDSIPDEKVIEAINDLGLGDWLESLSDGLDTELESGGGGLSAGEAQLLAFTRIFLRDPGLVILDEATSRLDPATEYLIERAVDKLVADRTAIVVAHRLGTVQRADDILILDDGEVIEYGPRQELAADPNSRFFHLLQTGMEEVLV